MIRTKETTGKLFGPLAERYRDRAGGYTRITKLGYRVGDRAPISMIQLIPESEEPSSEDLQDSEAETAS